MKIFEINICPDLSTGSLMKNISDQVKYEGNLCITSAAPKYFDDRDADYIIGTMFERHVHIVLGQLIGSEASFSTIATYKLIRYIKKNKPDIIHLHNIHQYYLNMNLLGHFLESFDGKIVWTFHDCWPYTGACHHYIEEQCYKWKTNCFDCPYQKKQRIKPIADTSKHFYFCKLKRFTNLHNLTIVTPSKWLAEEVKKSFYKGHSVYTISNGIDTDVFKYTESDLKCKYKLEGKKIILGIASHWSENKGLTDFKKLSTMLDDSYIIILIGVTDSVVQKNNILFLPRISEKEELAKWYSIADIYCNLSTEETFGLVVAEAMACGTPIIVYNSTALPELVMNTKSYICEPHDLNDVVQKINLIISNGRKYYSDSNREKTLLFYNVKDTARNYTNLFRKIMMGTDNND